MKYYSLRELRLPHIKAAEGIVVGNYGNHFIVLFNDEVGQTISRIEFYSSPNEQAWHCFKRQYIYICRRLRQKPWRTPESIDALAAQVSDLQ